MVVGAASAAAVAAAINKWHHYTRLLKKATVLLLIRSSAPPLAPFLPPAPQTFTESTANYNWKSILEDVVRQDDFYLSEGG